MAASGPRQLDLAEIYYRYRDIVSRNDHARSRELLAMLAKTLESREQRRDTIFCDLLKLMACLNLCVDSRQFNRFYDFVFFICRENGQKNITVNRAITAWKIVLAGRFRLLNQWCNFVENHQRHNISEDTWQQLLAFSRCVNEDLEGYDPKGAWPVLIDDFVEHMYRLNKSCDCGTKDSCSSYGDAKAQPSISNTFRGLNLHPGSKRKDFADVDGQIEEAPELSDDSTGLIHLTKTKRFKPPPAAKKLEFWEAGLANCAAGSTTEYQVDRNKHVSLGCLLTTLCAVEDSLSKGFEGHLSVGCCIQFDQKSRVSYT